MPRESTQSVIITKLCKKVSKAMMSRGLRTLLPWDGVRWWMGKYG